MKAHTSELKQRNKILAHQHALASFRCSDYSFFLFPYLFSLLTFHGSLFYDLLDAPLKPWVSYEQKHIEQIIHSRFCLRVVFLFVL